jgi:hypothetical protein
MKTKTAALLLSDASKSNRRLALTQNPREYNHSASKEMEKVCWDRLWKDCCFSVRSPLWGVKTREREFTIENVEQQPYAPFLGGVEHKN